MQRKINELMFEYTDSISKGIGIPLAQEMRKKGADWPPLYILQRVIHRHLGELIQKIVNDLEKHHADIPNLR